MLHKTSIGLGVGCESNVSIVYIFLPTGFEKHWPHSAYNSESILCVQPPPTLTCHCFVLCVQGEAAAVCTYIIGPIYQCYWKIEILLVAIQLNTLVIAMHCLFTQTHFQPASKKLVLEKTASANGNPFQTSVFAFHCAFCQNVRCSLERVI